MKRTVICMALLLSFLTLLYGEENRAATPALGEKAGKSAKAAPEISPAARAEDAWNRLLGPRPGRDQARKDLASLGSQAVPYILTHMEDPNWSARWEAVNTLGTIRDKQAADALVKRIVLDENCHVRWRALWALSAVGEPATTDKLKKWLESGNSGEKWNAAVGLAFFQDNISLPYLIEGLKSQDKWVRWEAVNGLSAVHDDKTSAVLIPLLNDADAGIQRETVMTLGGIGDETARAKLIELLDHADPQIRWRAAMGLGKNLGAPSIEALQKRLGVEKEKNVLDAIQDALKSAERDKK